MKLIAPPSVNQEWCEWINQLAAGMRRAVLANELYYFDKYAAGEMSKHQILCDALPGVED